MQDLSFEIRSQQKYRPALGGAIFVIVFAVYNNIVMVLLQIMVP